MFEQLRGKRISEAPRSPVEPPLIESVQPEAINDLNLSWNSHFSNAALRQHLQEFPGFAWRLRGYTDYIIGDYWRRRHEIGQITELRTRHYPAELLNHLLERFTSQGCQAVVLSNTEQAERPGFYASYGFSELERIVYYEKLDMHLEPSPPPVALSLEPYVSSQAANAQLLQVDHTAFPWLWRNNAEEIEHYCRSEGVVLYLAYHNPGDGAAPVPVGYFGFTLFDRWAHLDRLAVDSNYHGQKVGAYLLWYALVLMAQKGARRVTLSTQFNNFKSQKLYEGFGFQRLKSLEYSLVGKWL